MRTRYLATTFALSVGLLLGACTANDGAQGPPGVDGAIGDKGPTGNTGQAGATGATGDKGTVGDDGVKGPVGDDGPKGQTGDTGQPGTDGICAGTEPLVITGTTGLPDYILTGTTSPEFTIDVETASGTAVTAGLDFTWLSAGPDLMAGTADNAFTVPNDEEGSWRYDVWVTDGCHVASGSFAISVETFAAHVAAVDVSQTAGEVTFVLTGTTDPLFELTFLDATVHQTAPTATMQLDLLDASDAVLVAMPEMTLEHRGWYTLVVYDDAAGDTQVAVIEDQLGGLADADNSFGLKAFNAAADLGSFDLVDSVDGDAVLFTDPPLGALATELDEQPLGTQRIGVDKLGDGSVEFGYRFVADGSGTVLPGEIATVFVVTYQDGGSNQPLLLVRTASMGVGATYAAIFAVDPLSQAFDVVAGEGSLAPTNPVALDLPIASGSLEYTRTATVAGCAAVVSVVVGVDIPHTYRNDLEIELTAPDGESVFLNYDELVSGADFIGAFIDGASGPGLYNPDEPLSGLAGVNGNGTWTFRVLDTYGSLDNGVLNGWSVNLMCDNT